MNYGCFVLRGGRWILWTTGGRGWCESERDYLSDMLGLRAAVFVRKP